MAFIRQIPAIAEVNWEAHNEPSHEHHQPNSASAGKELPEVPSKSFSSCAVEPLAEVLRSDWSTPQEGPCTALSASAHQRLQAAGPPGTSGSARHPQLLMPKWQGCRWSSLLWCRRSARWTPSESKKTDQPKWRASVKLFASACPAWTALSWFGQLEPIPIQVAVDGAAIVLNQVEIESHHVGVEVVGSVMARNQVVVVL